MRYRRQAGQATVQLAAAAAGDRSGPDGVGCRKREREVVGRHPLVGRQRRAVGGHCESRRHPALRDDALRDLASMSGERDRKTAVEGPWELLGPGGMEDAATTGYREHRPDREAAPAGGEKEADPGVRARDPLESSTRAAAGGC